MNKLLIVIGVTLMVAGAGLVHYAATWTNATRTTLHQWGYATDSLITAPAVHLLGVAACGGGAAILAWAICSLLGLRTRLKITWPTVSDRVWIGAIIAAGVITAVLGLGGVAIYSYHVLTDARRPSYQTHPHNTQAPGFDEMVSPNSTYPPPPPGFDEVVSPNAPYPPPPPGFDIVVEDRD